MTTRDHGWRMLAWRLRQAGVPNPELDARLLVQAACGCDEIEMIREPGMRLGEAEMERLAGFEARRLAREPVSRILGRREFWGLAFSLSPATLDPRPDSETLIETALDCMREIAAPSILDLGTGTGCLLLALLHEREDARGLGIDISAAALDMAKRNAAALGLAARASFREGNWGEGLNGRFDLVISNPPYIARADIAALEEEVRAHDPLRALDGGVDGLDAYRALAQQLPALLKPGAAAVIELGQGQEAAVRALFVAAGLDVAPAAPDLSGVPRALVARLPRL